MAGAVAAAVRHRTRLRDAERIDEPILMNLTVVGRIQNRVRLNFQKSRGTHINCNSLQLRACDSLQSCVSMCSCTYIHFEKTLPTNVQTDITHTHMCAYIYVQICM